MNFTRNLLIASALLAKLAPRDERGRFVSRDCPLPECGYGTLQHEGDGFWACDGLADPGNGGELIECPHSHWDGEPVRARLAGQKDNPL